MRDLAGDRGIDAVRDARAPAHKSSDQTKRRKLRRAAARTKAYLNEMRRDW